MSEKDKSFEMDDELKQIIEELYMIMSEENLSHLVVDMVGAPSITITIGQGAEDSEQNLYHVVVPNIH